MPITRNINLLRIKVSKTINWIIELEMMPFHYEPNEILMKMYKSIRNQSVVNR